MLAIELLFVFVYCLSDDAIKNNQDGGRWPLIVGTPPRRQRGQPRARHALYPARARPFTQCPPCPVRPSP